jgi:hypothetical protein
MFMHDVANKRECVRVNKDDANATNWTTMTTSLNQSNMKSAQHQSTFAQLLLDLGKDV